MNITIESVIKAAAVATAGGTLAALIYKLVHWLDEQRKQSVEIQAMKEEQRVLTCGILACLKGLKEQGCNGPVTSAIAQIEEHLNKQAHK